MDIQADMVMSQVFLMMKTLNLIKQSMVNCSGFNTDYSSTSEPLKTLLMLCYASHSHIHVHCLTVLRLAQFCAQGRFLTNHTSLNRRIQFVKIERANYS